MKLKTRPFRPQTQAPATPSAPPASAPVASTPVAPLRKMIGSLPSPKRQKNLALMLVGATLIVLAGAIAASVAASFDDSLEVLVAAKPLAEGDRVDEDSFRTVRIAAAAGDIAVISPTDLPNLVGRVTAGPIGEGSPIHPDQFTDPQQESRVVIGAQLGPAQYPASGLRPGDHVRLLEVGSRFSSEEGTGAEVAVAEVVDVIEIGNSELHVGLRVGESIAPQLAQRVANASLALAIVDESLVTERVQPLTPVTPVEALGFDDTDSNAGEGESSE